MGEFRRAWWRATTPAGRAELVASGVSRRALAGAQFRRTSHGRYVPASVELTPTQRIAEAVAVMPAAGVLGGWAAAYARGVDWFDGRDPHTQQPQPVPVLLPPDLHRHGTDDVAYRRDALSPDEIAVVLGVRVTGAGRTAVDLARTAPDLVEAVVALDAMLGTRVLTFEMLERVASDVSGGRGAPQLRRALTLCRPHVKSPWESRLRMFWVLDLGLPTPEINRPVFDRAGEFLGAPDLLDEGAGLVVEFDGQGHRQRGQHRRDNVREEGLEGVGLVVVRVDSLDLDHHRSQLRRRLLAGRARGLGRDRSRDGWTLTEPENWLGMPA